MGIADNLNPFFMKKMIRIDKVKTLTLAVLSSLALFSCSKEDAAAPGVAFNLTSISKTSTIGTSGKAINWTNAFANTTEIRFETEKNLVEIEYTSDAHKKVDLFSTESILGNIVVPPGVYSSVEFEIELASTATEAALELKGAYNGTPITFKVGGVYEIETERENVTIADGKNYKTITELNFSLLTKGVTENMLANATVANGAIVISSSSNTNIYEVMLNNLHNIDEVELQ